MFDHDCIRRGQAESRSPSLGGEIRIEYPPEYIGGNAVALVPDRDPDVRVGTAEVILKDDIFGPNFDAATTTHCLASIDENIVEHLADLARIDLRGTQVFRDLKLNRNGRTRTGKVNSVCDELGDGSHPSYRSPSFGKGQ
jgi:hypothetical protein